LEAQIKQTFLISEQIISKRARLSSISLREVVLANIRIIALLIIGAVFVYLLDFPFSNTIYYSAIFLLYIRSKNHTFWGAFLLIMITNPWGLFYYTTYNWMIPVTSTISIPYSSFFGIVFFIKTRLVQKQMNGASTDYLRRFYKVIGVYTVFLILLSPIFGHSMASLYKMVVFLPSFLLFFSLPRLFRDTELITFNKIIFLFVIIHSLGVFYDIVSNGTFIKLITFGKPLTGAVFTEEIVRILGGIGLNLYAMVVGLFYVYRNDSSFNKNYLWLVILIAYITILASATRGWMIASSFLLVSSLLYSMFRNAANLKSALTFVFIFSIILLLLPRNVGINLTSAFERLYTIEAMTEGDLTAEGTVVRLTERGPRALTRFQESPVFGFGFSEVNEEYYDGHVGNHSLLLMGGVVGMIIVYSTILAIIFYFFRLDYKRIGRGLFIFGLALVAIMIIHSSSRAMISFYFPPDSAFIIALFFNHVNAALQKGS
jgi:hypothetical protein